MSKTIWSLFFAILFGGCQTLACSAAIEAPAPASDSDAGLDAPPDGLSDDAQGCVYRRDLEAQCENYTFDGDRYPHAYQCDATAFPVLVCVWNKEKVTWCCRRPGIDE